MASTALRSAAGVALVAGGLFLVLLGAERHGEQMASARPPTAPPPSSPPAVSSAPPVVTSAPAATSAAAPSVTASASAAPSASAASSASPAPSASAAARSGPVFHFGAGGIVLPKDELGRLIASAADLRRETGKITIEGFGDDPGTDDKATALGRRRAILARQVLSEIGLDAERLVVTVGDVGADASMKGAVRISVAGRTP